MKSRSAFFVLVLLLLTVTVCAAQSPMGFSPDDFYLDFAVANMYLGGPKYSFDIGNENDGAMISDGDSSYIYMSYSNNNVTELSLLSMFDSDDDEATSRAINLLAATLISLAYIAGEDADAFTTEQIRTIISSLVLETEAEYWGYQFTMGILEEDNFALIAMTVTK